MSTPAQVQAPEYEPVTTEEVKAHLRIEHDLDDVLLESYIKSAREQAEARLQRTLITTTFEVAFPQFYDSMPLRCGPVTEIVGIVYLDTDGVEQTLPVTEYRLRARRLIAQLLPAHNKQFPATICDPEAVVITFTAGMADNPEDLPTDIKQWIMLTVGQWYENREAALGSKLNLQPEPFYMGLLDRHRAVEL